VNIRTLISGIRRHKAGGGRKGLAELRELRQIAKDMREEDSAEASVDQRPRMREGKEPMRVFIQRLHKWEDTAEDRRVKRVNNVYKLQQIRKGTYEPPAAEGEKEIA
jgi:hypothetical protein